MSKIQVQSTHNGFLLLYSTFLVSFSVCVYGNYSTQNIFLCVAHKFLHHVINSMLNINNNAAKTTIKEVLFAAYKYRCEGKNWQNEIRNEIID